MTNEELVDRIQKGIDQKENLTQLYEQNQTMLRKFAKPFVSDQAELEDLLQEAWIGMQTAIDKYDPEAGFKFLTYAAWWIRQALSRYVQNYCRRIRFPCFVAEKVPKYLQFVKEYREEYGYDPDQQVICKALGIKQETIRNIEFFCKTQSFRSLEENISDDENADRTLADVVPDDSDMEADLIDQILSGEIKDQIRQILNGLEDRQRKIIIESMLNRKTLDDVGKEMGGISKERVRQIRDKGFEQIRHTWEFKLLQKTAFDLYGIALQGTSVHTFRRSFTSSTERAALKDIERSEYVQRMIQTLGSRVDLNREVIRELIKTLEPEPAKELIRATVADPEHQRIMVMRFVEQKSFKEILPDLNRRTGYRWVNLIMDEMVENLHKLQQKTGQIQPESNKPENTIPND